ncbi:hypothetical protein GCM10010497_23130 [Streptomyces cinereoruber]|uniref:Uncharacterized protein n=1 Tax=Streptomyces cinereoruber TaxID=67260 RepID=A0AAV4KK60_9ACTN|nr:hypothetical protein GCM10010497_23130 [Streptomyces cinereoruber]
MGVPSLDPLLKGCQSPWERLPCFARAPVVCAVAGVGARGLVGLCARLPKPLLLLGRQPHPRSRNLLQLQPAPGAIALEQHPGRHLVDLGVEDGHEGAVAVGTVRAGCREGHPYDFSSPTVPVIAPGHRASSADADAPYHADSCR